MSVKFSLLALLVDGPRHGYQLRSEFEQRTGGTWPLNIGQVYSTLQRLQRDGLVEPDGDPDRDGRITYCLTAKGRTETLGWFTSPVEVGTDARDELAIKLAVAVGLPEVDLRAVVQTQRSACLSRLQELTRLKRDVDDDDLAWDLVLDRLIFNTEAQARWLDHVEGSIRRHRSDGPVHRPTAPTTPSPTSPTSKEATR